LLLCSYCSKMDARKSPVSPVSLTCESLENPIALDLAQPRLGWNVQTMERGAKQYAYQILVSSSFENLTIGKADLWDSGKQFSEQSQHIPYVGLALPSAGTYYWKVRIWNGRKSSDWSEIATFGTGLLQTADWKANWIGLDKVFPWEENISDSRLAARYFRKEFSIPANVRQAKLFLCGLGLYELHLNGAKVGDQVLAPVPTDYTQDVKYNVFDLTSQLHPGKNAVGIVLGNGRFFSMRQHRKPWKNRTYGFPKMLFQLELTMADGSKHYILSDASWKVTADGPIRANNEYDGETYDATREFPGWDQPGFDEQAWLPVDLTTDPGENRKYIAGDQPQNNEPKTPSGDLSLKQARRVAQLTDNMKVMRIMKPKSITEVAPDTFVLDMGQNFAGWMQFRVKGPKGKVVRLHFAENIEPDGRIYILNLRDAKCTDQYTLSGKGIETWEPSFVYNGFRYVEVTGWPGIPTLDDFTGKMIYDNMATVGTFECSDSTMNGLFRNAWWSIASNYKGMPVDCPQRNERQPWMGDRSTGSWGESFLFDNQRLYAKWLDDIQESMTQEGQIPDVVPNFMNYYTDNMTWPGTYLFITNMLYHQYGDTASITKHYPSIKKWLSYMQDHYMTSDYLMTRDKYGDWCMPPESPYLIHSEDPARITDGTLIATAYFYHFLNLMQQFATVAGKTDDCAEYKALAIKVAAAFQQKFYNPTTKQYSNNTATANILPLYFNITPASEQQAVFQNVEKTIEVDNNAHICTGLIGTAWLMRTLTMQGRGDLALKIASNRTYPSWGYMLTKGATTIWELWNGDTANPWMNSQNHVMLLGDLLIWYYENVAGIKSDPQAPGFKRLLMKPDFNNGLTFVNATYRSIYGNIASCWKKDDQNLSWKITLPANTEATIYLPATNLKTITESGQSVLKAKGVKFCSMEKGYALFQISSGSYNFDVK
jgi:alpha-L-rhamnosidase